MAAIFSGFASPTITSPWREKRKGEGGRVRGMCVRVYMCTCMGEGEGGRDRCERCVYVFM